MDCSAGDRGGVRQRDGDLDRAGAQAHAHRHQLLPRQPVDRRRDGVAAQRDGHLRGHAAQQLALRPPLLQAVAVRRRALHLRLRLHPHGHLHGPVRDAGDDAPRPSPLPRIPPRG